MNIRLKKKIQQRLMDLEQQADVIKVQISEIKEFDSVKDSLKKDQLSIELEDTLLRIKHIKAANKKFSAFE